MGEYICGSRIDLTASQVGYWHFTCPSNIATNLSIVSIHVRANIGGGLKFYKDASSLSGTTTRTPFQTDDESGIIPSQAVLKSGIGTFTDGTVLDWATWVDPGGPFDHHEVEIKVNPGHTFAISFTAPSGIGATASAFCTITWRE